MNKFYSISEANTEPINSYQLKNLGEQTISMIFGSSSRGGFYGERESSSNAIYRKVTSEDYDTQFANKLTSINPPYDLENILNFHLNYYLSQNNVKETFIKHIKYVIIPIVEKRKNSNTIVELITIWINHQMGKRKENIGKITLKTGDVNSPIQFQINSDNSSQSSSIAYSNDDISKLFTLLEKDLVKLKKVDSEDLLSEIKSAKKQLEKGKDIKTRLLTIGELIKDTGIGVFTNLVSSPIYELVRPLLGM
jgi:hypothetical protein